MRWKFALAGLILLLGAIGAGWITVSYWGYLFSKTVVGEVVGIDRVTQATTVIGADPGSIPAAQLFSFAVAIRDKQSEIHTASSEDRQWAIVQKAQCVEARFFPYPPWQFDRAGTYHWARLVKIFDCR